MVHQVFIISDGTGRTARQTFRAALTQFKNSEVNINRRPYIRTKQQVKDVIEEAGREKGLVVHTVVSNRLRKYIVEQSRIYDVAAIDLMGHLLAQLSTHFSDSPSEIPGVFHELNKSYFQRIEAMEFTLRHDDGQRTQELKQADIVLLGVSRTFKTPLSVYLSLKGWMAANVPVILDVKLPDELFELDPQKVFCLTTRPNKLSALRKVRDEHLGGSTGMYAKLVHVKRELNYAETIYRNQPGWTIIEVTNKPIEEIASEILTVIRRRK